jgi:DNA modification methylase
MERDEDYLRWLDMCLAQFWRVLKPAGSLYLFSGHRLAADIEIMMRERFNVLNHIIWAKPSGRWNGCNKESLRSYFLQQSASCSLSITRGRINQRATGTLRREAS